MSEFNELKEMAETVNQICKGVENPIMGIETRIVLRLIEEIERVKALNHQQFGYAIRKNAEVEALRKDQERINFIEKGWFYAAGVNRQEFCFNGTWDTPGQDLREAIDLAIAKEQQS